MNTGITIRPSAIDTFYNCGWQWYNVFLLGKNTIPSARASIGTSIHKGVEVMWHESMGKGQKIVSLSAMTDAAVEEMREAHKNGLMYEDGEDLNTAEREVVAGTKAFVSDIVPFTDVPTGCEQRYTIKFEGHPVVAELSGTVDYIDANAGIIADVKTSKRTPTTANYVTQQSAYKLLAEANGVKVNTNLIQSVVLTKAPKGAILELDPDVERTKGLINVMLSTTETAAKDVVRPEVLFRGNPKYYLCSPKYCSLYGSCPFVTGKVDV